MFSIDRRSNPNQQGSIKDSGPYEARITSHLDGKYMGTLEVELLRSVDPGMDSLEANQRVQVEYLNPFYGVTNYAGVTKNNDYASSQQSYGMWFIPPDIGNIVLVIFVEGNINKGYWIGCVQAENQNFMIPDGRPATTFTDTIGNITDIGKKLPVGEYNKELLINSLNLLDATKNLKPVNTDFKNVLQNQGLLEDEIRGLTTTSARREAPSSVFGVSTPGPLDKRGNARGKGGRYYSRLGGSSIVMDDGDDKFLRKTSAATGPSEYVNKTTDIVTPADETIPHNELVRIRTRTGHQILLHNSEDLIYIGNAAGTTWIEMTANGKLDIFSQDSVSIHTQTDFNFKADRDVNIEAGRSINMKAMSSITEETLGSHRITVGSNQTITVAATQTISVGSTNHYADGNINLDTGGVINLNNNKAVKTEPTPLSTHTNPGESSGNIMKRVPQHEPWPHHENLNPDNVKTSRTDRTTIEQIPNSTLSGIPDTFKK
jgi:hypothetical protein